MKVHDLTPNEYWQTSQEDLDLATMLQHELQRGKDDVVAERKDEAERAKKKAEAEQKSAEILKRL